MKINEFKELEKKIKENDFHKGYRNINKVMFFLSIFGHIASIFLAYFLLFKILSGAIIESTTVAMVSTIVLLSGLELLKREVFDKFSLQYLKEKALNKRIIPLLLVSTLLVSMSFYATINGAKEFSSREKEITELAETNIDNYEDSINSIYNIKITEIENEIKLYKEKLEIKDKEQTELSSETQNKRVRDRINDLKRERSELKEDIQKSENRLKEVKKETDDIINEHKDKILGKTNEKKKENKSNTIFFIALSTIIELMILAGVYFNEYYKFRSYREYKSRLDKDPNYQRWFLYMQLLDVIYTEDTKMNDKLTTSKNIISICKLNGINLLPRDMMDLLKMFSSLGILKSIGSYKYINKTKESAQEILKKHFNIE